MKDRATAIRSPNTASNSILTSSSSSGTIVDLYPFSRGALTTKSASPETLNNPVGLDMTVETLRFTRRPYFGTRLGSMTPRQVQTPDHVNEAEDLMNSLRKHQSFVFTPSPWCERPERRICEYQACAHEHEYVPGDLCYC
ncbi:hypothetical protein F5Y18DRAFT_323792 [Xylariaceae sp. FL1019]|nr:hypothetical protein F5Y18DRAFT_323792 [Xylariaceae sp. FL1019]